MGTIEFPYSVNEVRVIDPCYKIENRILEYSALEKFVGGRYDCYATISDEGDWGNRVASLKIVKQGADIQMNDDIGGVAVDSGQAGFFFKNDYDSKVGTDVFYDNVCHITLSGNECGLVEDFGVVSSSGFGDGWYKVYVSRENGWDSEYLNGAEIVFIDDEYDEDNEDW